MDWSVSVISAFIHSVEHHLLPFFGTVHIVYYPKANRIAGFGHFVRAVDILARRPQLQERMTEELCQSIVRGLDPEGVLIVVKATHLCLTMRDQLAIDSNIMTTASTGCLKEGTDAIKKLGSSSWRKHKMDKIMLKGLHFWGHHGWPGIRSRARSAFHIDICLETDLSQAGASDDLHQTVDYSVVYARVKDIVENCRYQLIERLGTVIAEEILGTFPPVEVVTVTVHKPQAPIGGLFDDAAVVLERRRHG